MQEKGKFPSQTQPNPKELHEVSSSGEPNSWMDEVKAINALRSAIELNQLTPKAVKQGQEAEETKPEGVVIKETAEKNSTPHLFLKH